MARMRIGRRRLRPTIFLVISMLMILLGGAITLFWQVQHVQVTRADGGNVVGPPTLPAQTVDQILAHMGSPMVGTGAVVEEASRQTNIDDAFALGVWWTETNDGAAGVGLADRNPGSVRGGTGYPVAYDGYTIYPSYSAAIVDWFNLLRNRYVGRGLTSAYTICYSYVGTASSYQWAVKVVNLMLRYHGEASPPTPISSPTAAIPTPDLVQMQHKKVHVIPEEPATQGTTREAHVSGGVLPPDTKSNVSAAALQVPVAQPSALSTTPATSPFMIILGLLAALAIALWGVKIGYDIPAAPTRVPVPDLPAQPAPAFAGSGVMALPPLYVNEFSPVLMPQFSASTEQLAWTQREQMRQPVLSLAAHSVSGEGLLKRYANVDAMSGLQPASAHLEGRQQAEVAKNSYGPITETLSDPYRPAPWVPRQASEMVKVGARQGRLLRRYTLEKSEQE
jgi:hypothetical protein